MIIDAEGDPIKPGRSDGAAPFCPEPIDFAAFASATYRLEWFIPDVLVRDQPCVLGGPYKALKTSLALDLALSVATGTPFLGTFPAGRRARVWLLSGESGEATLQETALRIASAKGVDPPSVGRSLLLNFDLPQMGNVDHLANVAAIIKRHGIELLILDPLYLCLLSGDAAKGLSASNLYDMGPLFHGFARACLNAGATPILVHHFRNGNRDPYAEPRLDDLAFAGVKEFCRQWILLGRRSPFDPDDAEGLHQLWLSAGGSAGHGLLRALDVREEKQAADFGGRAWKVDVLPAQAARAAEHGEKAAEKERRSEAKRRGDEQAVMGAIDELRGEDRGATAKAIRVKTSLSAERVERALERLRVAKAVQAHRRVVTVGNGGKREATCFRRPAKKPRGRHTKAA